MKEIFIQFLKDNNAYDAFVKNGLLDHGSTIDSIIKNWTNNPEKWISTAFYWLNTDEGHDYWYRIEQAWKIILNKEEQL